MELSNEKIFKGAKEIKYLFKEQDGSDKLIVVFSGFPKAGSPALYNYVRSLEGFKENKLFILDEYGADLPHPQGCYYLGENKDLSVECSVISLITHIAALKNINFKDIILCGSSKGGFASIYFGIKYGFGKVISGGAQVLLGNYLLKEISVTRPVAQYIAGGTSEEDIVYMNQLIRTAIKEATKFPEMHIHVGKGEPHYKNHILPLITILDEKNIQPTLDLADYNSHSQLVEFFPKYLLNTLKVILLNSDVK
jgi:hypothetical protein